MLTRGRAVVAKKPIKHNEKVLHPLLIKPVTKAARNKDHSHCGKQHIIIKHVLEIQLNTTL
jgi:hypothetical protein